MEFFRKKNNIYLKVKVENNYHPIKNHLVHWKIKIKNLMSNKLEDLQFIYLNKNLYSAMRQSQDLNSYVVFLKKINAHC